MVGIRKAVRASISLIMSVDSRCLILSDIMNNMIISFIVLKCKTFFKSENQKGLSEERPFHGGGCCAKHIDLESPQFGTYPFRSRTFVLPIYYH